MSESLTLSGPPLSIPEFIKQQGPVATYPNKANDGVMGEFTGNNSGFGFMIGGQVVNSSSNTDNPGRTVEHQTQPPGFPHPNLVSRLFNFSSSFTGSYGRPHYMSLTSGDRNCGCDSGSGKSTYGTMVFRPSIVSFDIVVPGTANNVHHITTTEAANNFDPVSNFTVTDPVLGVTVPKYDRVIIMSMHSGSNNLTPTTNSSVCSKGDNGQPMSPFLTMSFCSSLDWPIPPIKKMGMSGSNVITHIPIRSAICTPHRDAPFWPGPGGIPGRSAGLTSGSVEPLSFEWRTREIAVYRSNGSQITVPSVVTGSFTDTMTSVSYEEAPTFFPALRNSGNQVIGLPSGATGAAVHTGYNQLGGAYAAVASQSLEFQCTMSRRSIADNSVISEHYASKSVMFTLLSS